MSVLHRTAEDRLEQCRVLRAPAGHGNAADQQRRRLEVGMLYLIEASGRSGPDLGFE
jgi:hypothetical protein